MKRIFSSLVILRFISGLLLTTAYDCPAQNIDFKRFVPPAGISMGLVRAFVQDKDGYIWFGGTGVFRYDGYQLKVFKNDPLDSNSLGSNIIESICAGKNGNIWIGTKGYGLDRLDPATGTFSHFRQISGKQSSLIHNKVTVLLEDRDGTLWVGTHGGLDRFDASTGTFIHYTHIPGDPSSLSCNQVRSIYEDPQGILWIGTGSPFDNDDSGPKEGGLNRLDKKTGKFTRYMHDPNDPHSLVSNKVSAIFEDSRGTFWIGTAGDGLHTMDRSKGIFTRHPYDPLHPDKLSSPPPVGPGVYDHIRFIVEDAAGYIFIGTFAGGLSRYDPRSNKATLYRQGKNAFGFTENSVWSAINTEEGVFWVNSWNGNLFYVDPLQTNIPYFPIGESVLGFYEGDNEEVWLATPSGLIRSSQTENITAMKNDGIRAVYKDRSGIIWVGTQGKISRWDEKKNKITHFKQEEKNRRSFSGGNALFITADRKGSLLIGSDNGLDVMDTKNEVFVNYKMIPGDTGSLSQNWVSAIHEDKWGNYWVGTYNGGGINLLDPKTGKFKHYLKGASISCLFEDSDNTLWVGTDGGLYQYNRPGNDFIPFADPKSTIRTANLFIAGIVEDDKKNLWMNTSAGILKLNLKSEEISIYGRDRGVNTEEQIFSFASFYKSRDGKLYFGNTSGYYWFFPDSIKSNNNPPKIVFPDFRIGNESIKPGANKTLDVPVNEAKEIRLTYRQKIFSFDFAAIHFTGPESNTHLFMLENYDNSWRQSGTEHTAYYYNVPPGRYIFRVKASTSNGVWEERNFAVIITPPWWQTWWAYCIYGILFITGIYLIHRVQKQKVVNAERERTRERELIQAKEIEKAYQQLKVTQTQLIQQEKMASLGELTAGIAHEIQNPLNFVNNFAEVNGELIRELKNEVSNGTREEIVILANDIEANSEKIAHHGKRAESIVKGMLQHSRTSSGLKEPTDINALCDEYLRLTYHGLRAKDQSFIATNKTDFDNNIGKLNIVRQEIGRVILNLINNAYYAVYEKQKKNPGTYQPAITVITQKVGDKIEISVKDNGDGIPQKILDKIFQPFFTTKPAGQGTGLGLSLSYDIIKAHGGELKVETREGEGSEFIMQLPAN